MAQVLFLHSESPRKPTLITKVRRNAPPLALSQAGSSSSPLLSWGMGRTRSMLVAWGEEAFHSWRNIQSSKILVFKLPSLGAKSQGWGVGVGERQEAEKHDTGTELFPNKKISQSFLRGPVSSSSNSKAYFKFYLNQQIVHTRIWKQNTGKTQAALTEQCLINIMLL